MVRMEVLVPLSHIGPGHAPIALIPALGYDRDEGLEVVNTPVGLPSRALEGVVTGTGDATFVNTAFGFAARDLGKPFKMFYAFARRMNRSFAVAADSPIATIADLKGARIALHYNDLGYVARAALTDEGVDPDRDVTFVDWRGSFDEAEGVVDAMRAGAIDAVWLLDVAYGLFPAAGLALRRVPSRTLDRLTPSASIYAQDRRLSEEAEKFAAYGRALAKATLFTLSNPEAAVRLVWKHIGATRPEPAAEASALRRDLAVLRGRLENLGIGDVSTERWGAISESEIAGWQDFMLATHAIRNRRPPGEYFDGSLISRFNAFDVRPVVAAARSFALS